MDRIRSAHYEKSFENIEFHLYFWNSTRTLLKPQCISVKLNSQDIWTPEKEVLHSNESEQKLLLILSSVFFC